MVGLAPMDQICIKCGGSVEGSKRRCADGPLCSACYQRGRRLSLRDPAWQAGVDARLVDIERRLTAIAKWMNARSNVKPDRTVWTMRPISARSPMVEPRFKSSMKAAMAADAAPSGTPQ